MLRLEQHQPEDAHQGDHNGQQREQPDNGRQFAFVVVLEAQLLVENTNDDIARLRAGIDLRDTAADMSGTSRNIGSGRHPHIDHMRQVPVIFLLDFLRKKIETERRYTVLQGLEVEIGTETYNLLVGRHETVDTVADLHFKFPPRRFVENHRSEFLVEVALQEIASVGNRDTHHAQEIRLYDITLESDLTALELPAPAHTPDRHQTARSSRNILYLRVG